MRDMAESASVVADEIIKPLEKGEFHCFPYSMAMKFWDAYEQFSKTMIEADFSI